MVPIKRKNIKQIVITNPIYSSDKKPVTPVLEKVITVVNNAVRKDHDRVRK